MQRLEAGKRLAWLAALALVLSVQAQPGPRLTDQQLFDALNLNYSGLQQVRADMLTTNLAAAKADLASYLRARTNVTWFYDWHNPTTAVSYSRTQADQSTNGTVSQVGYTYTFPGGDIDWFYNYTTNPACGCVKNNEWQWTLNRMGWWANLGRTYWATREETYALAWSRQLRDWIADCPVVSSRANGSPSTWRTIESGIRMNGAWPDAFFRFVLSPSMTNEEHVLYLKSCVEHARYLTNWYTSENFLTMEMNGLYAVGALFPELKEATGWRTFAAAKLYAEQTNQFLPDGVHNELTARYHGVSVDNTLGIYDLALINNRVSELPPGYLSRMEKAFEFYVGICAPPRVTPAFNDSSRENVRTWLTTALQYFPNRLDFQWLASGGVTGAPPAQVSWRFPYAGYGVMRSGWETNVNYLCFDAGALGYSGHRHEDKLNVVLWANGREFLFDSGGGPYDSSIWRTWGQSSYSHNTIVVDGLDQEGGDGSTSLTDPDYVAQAPIDIRWESDVYHDFAAGVYNRGYGGNYNNRPASQTRRVLFVKPDIFIFADTLVPANASNHTYQARWHLRETNTAFASSTKVVTTTDAGQPNLAVVPCYASATFVTNVSAQTSAAGPGVTNLSEMLGWDLPNTTSLVVPATTVTHTLSGAGTQQFVTVFLPLAAGATNPVVAVNNPAPNTTDIWLNDGRRLNVFADPNPARGLKLTEILADGSTNRYVGAGFVPPVFSGLTNRVMNPNCTRDVQFSVIDPDAPAFEVPLQARSLTPGIVPDSGLLLSGSGSNRVLSITPLPGRSGPATIVLSATDADGSTISSSFVLTVSSAPEVAGTTLRTTEGEAITFDLRNVISDDLTPDENLALGLGNAFGGSILLMTDGRTAQFNPAPGYSGGAGFEVVATDMGFDPRCLLYYSFETPAALSGNGVLDASGSLRDGTVTYAGTGAAFLDTDVPPALGLANQGSIRLLESLGTNTAQISRSIATNDLNLSDHDWTFTGWFKRAALTTEDFILYVGNGDGFGANEELQLHGVAGAPTLNLRHYIGETNTDVFLAATNIAAGEWHHAAVTFTRTNVSAGILRLYVDGAAVGSGSVPVFNLDQTVPIVFGGHNRSNSKTERWFNGWMDDLAIFNAALAPGEIAKLANRTVGHNAGLSSTNLVPVLIKDTNAPPVALPGARRPARNQSVDIDLATLCSDAETPLSLLRFAVSGATNGTVSLLADGHTARFTPALNFEGKAGFTYTVTDMGIDPRAVLHYSFEPPDLTTDATITDNSAHDRDGSLDSLNAGSFGLSTSVPSPLARYDSASLQLNEVGTNGLARLRRMLTPAELDMSDHDWTFAGWSRRAASTSDDFVFYIGNGDGFGSNEELQLYGPSGGTTLTLRHYIGEALTDVNLSAAGGAAAGQWHHAALTFTRTNAHSGILRFYLDGVLAGTAWPQFNLVQTVPLVFGGHNNPGYMIARWFGGNLDDLVLFSAALTASEINRLATGTVGHFGGLSATNGVTLLVGNVDARPTLSNAYANSGGFRFRVDGTPGFDYYVQATTNVSPASWTTIWTNRSATTPFDFIDPQRTNASRFYRVLLGP